MASRRLRLFEGYTIKFNRGRIVVESKEGTVSANIADVLDDGYYFVTKGPNWVPDDVTTLQGSGDAQVGLRFQNVRVPQGAIIMSATITVTHSSLSGTSWGSLYGNKIDNAPAWSATNHPGTMTQTTASVAIPNTSSNPVITVTTIVQEIVNRNGWLIGNAMAFGGDLNGNGNIQWQTREAVGANASVLRVAFR